MLPPILVRCLANPLLDGPFYPSFPMTSSFMKRLFAPVMTDKPAALLRATTRVY